MDDLLDGRGEKERKLRFSELLQIKTKYEAIAEKTREASVGRIVVVVRNAGKMREVRGEVWVLQSSVGNKSGNFFFLPFPNFFTSKSVCTAHHLLGDWTWPKRCWTPDRLFRYMYKLPTLPRQLLNLPT